MRYKCTTCPAEDDGLFLPENWTHSPGVQLPGGVRTQDITMCGRCNGREPNVVSMSISGLNTYGTVSGVFIGTQEDFERNAQRAEQLHELPTAEEFLDE